MAGPRGFDGAKKLDAVKRHALLDSAGVLIAAVVTPADVQDRAAFPKLLPRATPIAPTISHVWVDNGYTRPTITTNAGVTVDVASGPKPGHRFNVQPRRWVIQRTNAWINYCRRIDPHYETTLTAHEEFAYPSQIAPLLRRLDHNQLLDTL